MRYKLQQKCSNSVPPINFSRLIGRLWKRSCPTGIWSWHWFIEITSCRYVVRNNEAVWDSKASVVTSRSCGFKKHWGDSFEPTNCCGYSSLTFTRVFHFYVDLRGRPKSVQTVSKRGYDLLPNADCVSSIPKPHCALYTGRKCSAAIETLRVTVKMYFIRAISAHSQSYVCSSPC